MLCGISQGCLWNSKQNFLPKHWKIWFWNFILMFFFNFMKLQFYELLVLRANKCFWNAPHQWASLHDDVIKWKHFPHYWPLVWGIQRSLVNSPHKGQWHGALMFSFICTWINAQVNNREAGDLRHHHAHYDVIKVLVNFLPNIHSWCTWDTYIDGLKLTVP